MAEPTKDIENWIRSEFLPQKFGQVFTKRKLGVQSGAVSEDGNIVCIISTSLNEKPENIVLVYVDKSMDASQSILRRFW